MSETVNLEGSAGRITWTIPEKLSESLNASDPSVKQQTLAELSNFLNSYTHLLWGSIQLPPKLAQRNLLAISSFIDALARESLSDMKRLGLYE